MPQNESRGEPLLQNPSQDTELTQLDPAHWRPSQALADTPETQYSGASGTSSHGSDADPLKEEEQHHLHHWETEKPHLLKTLLIQLFAFLWLVPILALLILNIKRHIIGASAWCPFGHCLPAVYATSIYENRTAVELPAKYDRETHNLLGSLQFVSKALEVWFIIIATWLVYLITMRMAHRPAGLPIGYFTRPSECTEVPSAFDPLLWATMISTGSRKPKWRLVCFFLATLLLCAICNLMGPAVAVLVLPSLQWIELDKFGLQRFVALHSEAPPYPDGFTAFDAIDNCNSSEIRDQRFSCNTPWKSSLNSWIKSYQSSQWSSTVVSVQDLVSFSYNTTYSPVNASDGSPALEIVNWIPNRQALSMLSRDALATMKISSGKSPAEVKDVIAGKGFNDTGVSAAEFGTFIPYNNTVQTLLRRNGPILGALSNAWLGYDSADSWTTTVDPDRSLRCYAGYNLSVAAGFDLSSTNLMCPGDCKLSESVPLIGASYTRCVSVGTGWKDGYKSAHFTIFNRTTVNITASGQAAFLLNGKLPTGLDQACLVRNSTIPRTATCDWEAFWKTGSMPEVRHRSQSVNTIEFNWSEDEDQPAKPNVTFAMDFVAFQAFANYTMDPSFITNPLFTADYTLNLSRGVTLDEMTPVAIDPAWSLVGWAVNANSNVPSSDSSLRTALQSLSSNLETLYEYKTERQALWNNKWRLISVGLMPILQTLSLVDYSTTTVSEAQSKINDPQHPLLQRSARINVYAYGVNSRTSWLGVVVTSAGCIVVLIEVCLGLFDRRRFRSLTQLLVAALEHSPTDEFRDYPSEKMASRVRFRLQSDTRSTTAGKLRFEKVS